MVIKAGERRVDLIMVEEDACATRILSGDQIDLPQDPQGAQGDVFQITDRCRHHIQCPWHTRTPNKGREIHIPPAPQIFLMHACMTGYSSDVAGDTAYILSLLGVPARQR